MDARPADLADVLLTKGVVSMLQLRAAQEARRKAGGGDIGDFVVQLGYASDEQVSRCRATLLDIPFIDINRVVLDTALLHILPKIYLFKHQALPIERKADGRVLLAVANPQNVMPLLRRLEAATGAEVELAIAPRSVILDRLVRLFGPDFTTG